MQPANWRAPRGYPVHQPRGFDVPDRLRGDHQQHRHHAADRLGPLRAPVIAATSAARRRLYRVRTSSLGLASPTIDPTTFVGTGGVTGAHDSALTRKRTSVAVAFNPIVSVPLFTALQRAYGTINDQQTEVTNSLAAIPSLPSSVLRAVFNGTSVLTADEITVNGQNVGDHIADFAGGSDIYVCRRGDTSGTMTSFKLHFLNQGCSEPGHHRSVRRAGRRHCGLGLRLERHLSGPLRVRRLGLGRRAFVRRLSSQRGRLAIGVASTEAKPGASSNRFRYIKVDGAEPTLKAVIEGRYSFFTENTFNDKFPSTSASGSQTLWDKLYASIGNSTAISELNRARGVRRRR